MSQTVLTRLHCESAKSYSLALKDRHTRAERWSAFCLYWHPAMKKYLNRTRLTALAFTTFLAMGCSTTSDYASETHEAEPVVERGAWLSALNDNIGESLCADGEVFRSCYQVAESECRVRAHQAATSCEHPIWNSIPDALNDQQGQELGSQIGRCAGDEMAQAFDVSFAYTETEQCKKVLSAL